MTDKEAAKVLRQWLDGHLNYPNHYTKKRAAIERAIELLEHSQWVAEGAAKRLAQEVLDFGMPA